MVLRTRSDAVENCNVLTGVFRPDAGHRDHVGGSGGKLGIDLVIEFALHADAVDRSFVEFAMLVVIMTRQANIYQCGLRRRYCLR